MRFERRVPNAVGEGHVAKPRLFFEREKTSAGNPTSWQLPRPAAIWGKVNIYFPHPGFGLQTLHHKMVIMGWTLL